MGSQHCIGVVTTVLQQQKGVIVKNIQVGMATITIDETIISKMQVVGAIEKMGYKVID